MIRRAPGILPLIRGFAALTAEIISLCDRRVEAEADVDVDLRTAVEVAIPDLREIEAHWGTELALERLAECRAMLRSVLATS